MSDTLSTALERQAETPEAKTVRDLMERNAADFAAKLPRGLEYDYFKQAVYSEMRRVPQLFECDPVSVVSAVAFALQLGLSPGPLGHCYLVPFGRECQFILGYKGMIDLAFRSGLVKDVSAELVHDGDTFRVAKGTTPKIVHEPSGPDGDREIVAAYSVARLTTGGTSWRVIYPEDWEAARKRSASGSKGKGPWATDFRAMVRKTAVRRAAAVWPQATQFGLALAWDDRAAPPLDEPEALSAPLSAEDGQTDV